MKLFASVLRRDEEGDYWLQTPAERKRIVVEDAPFVAEEIARDLRGTDQRLSFRTNLDEWVEAGPAHPIRVAVNRRTGEPRPYLLVRDRLEALILRSVFYELAELAVESAQDKAGIGVWSNGVFFALDGED